MLAGKLSAVLTIAALFAAASSLAEAPSAGDSKVARQAPAPGSASIAKASSVGASVIGYTTDAIITHVRSLDHFEFALARADLEGDGHTLVPLAFLHPTILADVNTLVVGFLSDLQTLTPAQVNVIENFVRGGGKLVFLGENNTFYHANNVALGGRFGIEYPLTDPPECIIIDVPDPRHGIMAGPYGEVDVVDGCPQPAGRFGSMSSPGPYGRSILDFPGGNSAAVVIEPGALGPGSGPVIAFTDVNVWQLDRYNAADNRALWRNAFAHYYCGNRLLDPGEECDDAGESATCDTDCTLAEHGDGTVNVTAGEECDDGAEFPTCDNGGESTT
ncbi:MAG: hypothetical protein KJ749_12685 [Planctomycetes bacterium]|nr:hypothetical protein [Planctomycetota bacterium]